MIPSIADVRAAASWITDHRTGFSGEELPDFIRHAHCLSRFALAVLDTDEMPYLKLAGYLAFHDSGPKQDPAVRDLLAEVLRLRAQPDLRESLVTLCFTLEGIVDKLFPSISSGSEVTEYKRRLAFARDQLAAKEQHGG